VCQVDEVRKCLKPKELQKALKSLPRTLDDTYARILCNIDEQHSADVFKILQWLVYSTRPMAIEEIAEVVAIDTEEDCRLDLENRLREPHDILTICSSLVTTTRSTVMEGHERYREIEELKLAHFSVKEYLISDRMRNTKASRYSLTDYSAHDYIARTCLVYLLHFDEPTSLTLDNIHEFPLVEYAARYWTQHVKEVEKETHEYKAQELCMKLLSLQHTAYFIWLRLLYSSKPWEEYCTIAVPESVLPPLYFSSLNGLIVSTKMLLEAGADVNTQAGEYDNALQADINVQDEAYGNALQAASSRGHETVVRLLLDAGANVNAQGELYGNALQAASNEGHETVVRLLLDAGVNVNAQGGKYGNALQAASAKRHEAAIRLLLDAEANVNAQGGKCDTALQATIVERGKSVSHEKYEAVIQLLLKAEAKVNAENEEQENRAFNHLSLEA